MVSVRRVIAACILLVACGAPEQEPEMEYVSTRYLMELEELLQLENYVLVDVRKPEAYFKGHIPGAINAWRPQFRDTSHAYGGMMAPREQMEQLLGSWGMSEGKSLVLYDGKGGSDAARLWWVLNYYAQEAHLLNGGLKVWEDSLHNLTTDTVLVDTTVFAFPGTENHTTFATMEEVLKAIDDTNVILLDTRTLEEFTGEKQKKGAYKAGRIPSSTRVDWGEAVRLNEDHKFKSAKVLKEIYESYGVTPDKTIITYCQSGSRSSNTTFVLTELLGYPNVKNYDGSWIEWSYHDSLPIASDVPLQ